jgi:homopolymeric O-antigen transport system permease protein
MRRSLTSVLLLAWLTFSVQYRRTLLGPLWVIIGPALFVLVLGNLFGAIGARRPGEFIPFLAVGLILWTLIGGLIPRTASVFQRNRAHILQGSLGLHDIVVQDVIVSFLTFAHQLIIVIVVMAIYRVPVSAKTLLCVPGLALILANGLWTTSLFGVLGARYRDLTEVFAAVMRIAFLATPILWVPGQRGGLIGQFATYNPFTYFLEVVRAPLLGGPIEPLAWIVVGGITLVGFILAGYVNGRYAKYVSLWV